MNNQGFTGFLIRKTVQPNSLRQDHTNFNDYRNSNMIVYLNKKIGDMRGRSGVSKLPRSVYTNTILSIKPKVKAESSDQKQIQSSNYLSPQMGKVIKQVMDKMHDNNYEEPFFVEQGINSAKRPKTAVKNKIDTSTKLKVMMNENISQKELELFFDFYKKQNLKATLNEIKSQLKDSEFYKKFQQRMKSLETVEFDDQEQVNFFLSQLCEKRSKEKLTAGKVLGVNDERIKYKQDIHDEFEQMRSIVQKRITQEQMNSILKQEEEDYQSKLVKIFKETRIDQFDPDFFKNKIKMTTMKRVNEAQEKQYQNFFVGDKDHKENDNSKTNQFLRNPKRFAKKFAKTKSVIGSMQKQQNLDEEDQRMEEETMPTSCRRTFLSMDSDFSKKMSSFTSQCALTEKRSHQEKKKLNNKLDYLEDDVEKTLNILQLLPQQALSGMRKDEFEKFKKERKFKKKLVGYLIEHVEKQSDLLSQKMIEENSKRMFNSE